MKFLLRLSNEENRSQDFPKSRIEDRQSKIRRQAGMALVITLSLVVLVTIATMAFFARSMSNRAIESSRANRVEADQLARTAADYVTGQFLQEISANSTNTTTSGVTIYQPTTNTFAVPQCPLPSSTFSGTNFANLIRRSVNETTNGVGEANASAHSTATASRNGRTVGPVRWNAPFLLAGTGFTNTTQLPNWIYANSDGSTTSSPGAKTIGRYAYNVYNIGGLLDANVAGFPSGVSGTNLSAIKGTLAGADLSVIPGITDTNAFVSWRNAANAGIATSYVTAVTNALTNGFLRVPPGDNRLASRHDLINLARDGSHGISTAALPYFTVFARSENAPNWQPKIDRGGSYNYLSNANNPASINPNLPNVRVTGAFTRLDGSPATMGEPLLKKRFPLSKISILNGSGNASDIMNYFGLTATAAGWTYDHGDPTKIKTLQEVVQAGREPDFFELLKAVVLNGSLGRDPGAGCAEINYEGPDGVGFDIYSSSPDMQVLQIGANIIDQFDADSYPTAIYLDSISDTSAVSTIVKTVYGIENLPYLYQMNQVDYTTTGPFTDYTAAGMSGYAAGWMQPVIWNPHVPREASSTGVPQNFRVNTYGSTTFSIWVQVWDPNQNPQMRDSGPWLRSDPVTYNGSAAEGQITFSLATADTTYSSGPTPLTTANASTVSANQLPTGNSVGILNGTVNSVLAYGFITQTVNSANAATGENNPPGDFHFDPANGAYFWCHRFGNPDISFVLEYQDSSGIWRPYSHMARLASFEYSGWRFYENGYAGFVHVDPRTDRFSVSQTLLTSPSIPNTSIWNTWTTGKTLVDPSYPNGKFAFASKTTPRSSAGFHFTPGYQTVYFNPIPFGEIFQNTTSSGCTYTSPQPPFTTITGGNAYYTDKDGVVRPADGAEANLQTGAGCPIFPAGLVGPNAARHPIVLNRPFRSVGELGYVFRDQPFCSLNFASPDSGDLGIMDAFCVGDEPEVTAGRINPNSASKEVLASIISQAVNQESPVASQSQLSAANALSVAQGVKDWIAVKGPMTDRENLANAVANSVKTNLNQFNEANKNLREASIRALAPVSDLRTWNLLIDVVAQTGRFPAGSSSASDFDVRGEKRYWLQIAIDRVTGKVIGKNLENANE